MGYVRFKGIKITEYHIKVIEQIHQEYFNEFGVSDDFKKHFDMQKELMELECERSISGNKFLGTRINILKGELQNSKQENRESNVYDIKSYIDKYLGTRTDPKQITVREFYSYLELIKKDTRNGKD